jgi:hypothetical protein
VHLLNPKMGSGTTPRGEPALRVIIPQPESDSVRAQPVLPSSRALIASNLRRFSRSSKARVEPNELRSKTRGDKEGQNRHPDHNRDSMRKWPLIGGGHVRHLNSVSLSRLVKFGNLQSFLPKPAAHSGSPPGGFEPCRLPQNGHVKRRGRHDCATLS